VGISSIKPYKIAIIHLREQEVERGSKGLLHMPNAIVGSENMFSSSLTQGYLKCKCGDICSIFNYYNFDIPCN